MKTWVTDLNRHFPKEATKVANQSIRKMSNVIKHQKNAAQNHKKIAIFGRLLSKGKKRNAGKDVEQGNVSHTVGGTRSKDWLMENSIDLSQELPYDPVIS